MAGSGWNYQKLLQDATRAGYDNLSSKAKDPDNSLAQELVIDLVLIGIGLAIYIQLDIKPFLPFNLPDVIQNGSYTLFVILFGWLIAGIGGIRMLFALFEAGTWLVASLFPKKKTDE